MSGSFTRKPPTNNYSQMEEEEARSEAGEVSISSFASLHENDPPGHLRNMKRPSRWWECSMSYKYWAILVLVSINLILVSVIVYKSDVSFFRDAIGKQEIILFDMENTLRTMKKEMEDNIKERASLREAMDGHKTNLAQTTQAVDKIHDHTESAMVDLDHLKKVLDKQEDVLAKMNETLIELQNQSQVSKETQSHLKDSLQKQDTVLANMSATLDAMHLDVKKGHELTVEVAEKHSPKLHLEKVQALQAKINRNVHTLTENFQHLKEQVEKKKAGLPQAQALHASNAAAAAHHMDTAFMAFTVAFTTYITVALHR